MSFIIIIIITIIIDVKPSILKKHNLILQPQGFVFVLACCLETWCHVAMFTVHIFVMELIDAIGSNLLSRGHFMP